MKVVQTVPMPAKARRSTVQAAVRSPHGDQGSLRSAEEILHGPSRHLCDHWRDRHHLRQPHGLSESREVVPLTAGEQLLSSSAALKGTQTGTPGPGRHRHQAIT
jgi:hypothetical protein